MKKLLLFTNIVSLLIFFLFGCTNPNPKPICATNYTCYDSSFTNTPFDGVEASLVQQMIGLYRQNHWNKMRINDTDSADSRWVWFSLARLKQFIYDVEKNACDKGCGKNTELGVRMYYTEYPDSSQWSNYSHLTDNNVPTNFQKRHTLLLVPTYNSAGINYDFDPRSRFTNCSPPDFAAQFDKLLNQGDTQKIKFYGMLPTITRSQQYRGPQPPPATTQNTDELGVMNRGTMAPPPTDQVDGGKVYRNCKGSLLMDKIDNIRCGSPQVGPTDDTNNKN